MSTSLDKYLQTYSQGYHPFAEIEAGYIDGDASDPNGINRNGEGDADDIDMEEVEKLKTFPTPPPPSFADPASFAEAMIDQLLVLLKGPGVRRSSRLVRLGVSQVSFIVEKR